VPALVAELKIKHSRIFLRGYGILKASGQIIQYWIQQDCKMVLIMSKFGSASHRG
jgi:hypothetical protein